MATGTVTAADPIRRHIQRSVKEDFGPVLNTFHRRLLSKGTAFEGRTPSNEFPDAVEFKRYKRPQIKRCFYNSAIFVLYFPKVQYWEGYALCPKLGFVFPHAWVVMPGRKVLDLTAEALERFQRRKYGEESADPRDYRYVGLRVPSMFVIKSLTRDSPWTVLPEYLISRNRKLRQTA